MNVSLMLMLAYAEYQVHLVIGVSSLLVAEPGKPFSSMCEPEKGIRPLLGGALRVSSGIISLQQTGARLLW